MNIFEQKREKSVAWEKMASISLFSYNLMTGQDQTSLPLVILFLFETLNNL